MDIKELISQKLEIPADVVMDIPKITIVGENEVFIENYVALCECKNNIISLKYKGGIIEISGENLIIRAIGEGDIMIFGKIACVKLI